MSIKKTIKRMGKSIIGLKQENNGIIGQSILVVDNGYSWIGQLCSAIERIKDYFPRAEISVLAFHERRDGLEKDFPGLKFIHPSERLRPRRYGIALQMLMLRKKRYDFVILSSLDITPLITALLFFNSRVVLYNQWGQWWSLKLRNLGEIFKRTYARKRTRFKLKNILKEIGLFFVLVQRKDEALLKHSVLVVDNGYASFKHVDSCIGTIKESLTKSEISVLAMNQREGLNEHFNDIRIVQAKGCLVKRYQIARGMLRLRKNRHDYIILLSLDITPVIVSMLFMKGRVILFNRWQQWWSLKPRSVKRYLTIIPKFICNIVIFIYLSISVSWIFLKRSFNLFRFNLSGRRL